MTTTNGSSGHGHDEPALGAVNPEAIAAGHEPDNTFAVKPIMSIPLAVVVTFVIAFSVAAGAFTYFNRTTSEPFAHPEAIAQNAKGTNARLDRIERAGLRENKLREFDQPRLEPLRRLEKDGMFYVRVPMPQGNSPEIHPEEIRPDRVSELNGKAAFADKDHKFAKLPIEDAIKLAAADKNMFPVAKGASKPVPTADRPSASSGGRGTVPALPKADEKKDEGKKDEKK
jgi:hypothetical protein